MSQPNPVHIPTSHLLEIHPNIIHPSTPRFPQWSPSLRWKISLSWNFKIVFGSKDTDQVGSSCKDSGFHLGSHRFESRLEYRLSWDLRQSLQQMLEYFFKLHHDRFVPHHFQVYSPSSIPSKPHGVAITDSVIKLTIYIYIYIYTHIHNGWGSWFFFSISGECHKQFSSTSSRT